MDLTWYGTFGIRWLARQLCLAGLNYNAGGSAAGLR